MTGITIKESRVQAAVDWLYEKAPERAAARAARVHMEKYIKTVLAKLYRQSNETTASAKEMWAESHPEYLQALEDYKAAIEADETFREKSNAAETLIAVYRTHEASTRKGY